MGKAVCSNVVKTPRFLSEPFRGSVSVTFPQMELCACLRGRQRGGVSAAAAGIGHKPGPGHRHAARRGRHPPKATPEKEARSLQAGGTSLSCGGSSSRGSRGMACVPCCGPNLPPLYVPRERGAGSQLLGPGQKSPLLWAGSLWARPRVRARSAMAARSPRARPLLLTPLCTCACVMCVLGGQGETDQPSGLFWDFGHFVPWKEAAHKLSVCSESMLVHK